MIHETYKVMADILDEFLRDTRQRLSVDVCLGDELVRNRLQLSSSSCVVGEGTLMGSLILPYG